MHNKIDVNLLFVLNKLLDEKHVSNTAFTLNISQSKVSRALQKLRELFNDELLVRTTNGYELTTKAEKLKKSLGYILHDLDMLFKVETFVPDASKDELRIFSSASVANIVLPDIMAKLWQLAPGMKVSVNSNSNNHFDQLLAGNIHFSISTGMPGSGEQDLHRIRLLDWEHCILMRANHPLANQVITSETLMKFPFGRISINGSTSSCLAPQFEKLGLTTETSPLANHIELTDFTTAAAIAEKSDILFHVPQKLAERASKDYNLILKEVPDSLKFPTETVYLYWHKRYHTDPMCVWVRSLFKSS